MVFQLKVLLKSGLGDDVYGPPYVTRYTSGEEITQKHPNYNDTIDEMDLMMFGALDELLLKTGIDPRQIDYLLGEETREEQFLYNVSFKLFFIVMWSSFISILVLQAVFLLANEGES